MEALTNSVLAKKLTVSREASEGWQAPLLMPGCYRTYRDRE